MNTMIRDRWACQAELQTQSAPMFAWRGDVARFASLIVRLDARASALDAPAQD